MWAIVFPLSTCVTYFQNEMMKCIFFKTSFFFLRSRICQIYFFQNPTASKVNGYKLYPQGHVTFLIKYSELLNHGKQGFMGTHWVI